MDQMLIEMSGFYKIPFSNFTGYLYYLAYLTPNGLLLIYVDHLVQVDPMGYVIMSTNI